MRIHSDRTDKRPLPPEVTQVGRALLEAYEFQRRGNRGQHEDYELGVIVRNCLAGNDGKRIARKLCRNILTTFEIDRFSGRQYDDLMTALLTVHPADVLDELATGRDTARSASIRLIQSFYKNPMSAVSDDTIINWCDEDPITRYTFAAAIAELFDQSNDQVAQGWRPIVRALLLKAPDKEVVFKVVAERVSPTGGVGSISSQYESRIRFLDQLDISDMPSLSGPMAFARAALQSRMDAWRRRETEDDRTRSGTFE